MAISPDALIDMGIEPAKAHHAAGRSNTIDEAIEWLFSAEGADWSEPAANPDPPAHTSMEVVPHKDGGEASSAKDVRFAMPQLVANSDMPVEDDELNQALALSLAEAGGARPSTPAIDLASTTTTPTASAYNQPRPQTPINPTIGPSNQMSNTNYGLVSMDKVSAPPAAMTEEETLKRALEDSVLTSSAHAVDQASHVQPTELYKSGSAPTCLWTGDPVREYAASVIQGLNAIPQIRNLMWTLSEDQPNHLKGNPLLALAGGLFTHLDQSDLAYHDMFREEFPWALKKAGGNPLEQSKSLIQAIQNLWTEYCDFFSLDDDGYMLDPNLERLFATPEGKLKLFNSYGCSAAALPNQSPGELVVKPNIEICPSERQSTMYEAFADQLWLPQEQNAFVEPAEVMLISVRHEGWGPKVLFKLEEDFYVDRFLSGNSAIVAQLRANEGVLKGEQAQLRERKRALSTVNGKDVRQALVTTLKYYTTVARPSGDAEKDASLANSRAKLEKILAKLDNEQDSITSSLKSIKEKQEKLFDTPDLQRYKYELHAILYHDGLYGLGHTYSYIRQHDGKWWKVSDGVAKEVETKEALGDATGLHLGSGPYALFYSKAATFPTELPTVGGRPKSISSVSDLPVYSGADASVEGSEGLVTVAATPSSEAAGGKSSLSAEPETSSTTLTPDASAMDLDPTQRLETGGSTPTLASTEDAASADAPEMEGVDSQPEAGVSSAGEGADESKVDVDAV